MTLHFVHVGKTGGTAIKRTLRQHGLACGENETPRGPPTPYGPIQVHPHRFRMFDVPEGDYAFFVLRDPVERFRSGFLSRQNQGLPGHSYPWTSDERKAFEAFPTASELIRALGSQDRHERELAEWAMGRIRHLGFMYRIVGTPRLLRAQLGKVVFVGMQETLARDWEQLKAILELPADIPLPRGRRRAHRQDPSQKEPLDPQLEQQLRLWYRRDYQLLLYCHRLRAWHGWGPEPTLPLGIQRLRGLQALLPQRPARDRVGHRP